MPNAARRVTTLSLWQRTRRALPGVRARLPIGQEMSARLGAVTGKGLAELLADELSMHWTAFAMLTLLIAMGGRPWS